MLFFSWFFFFFCLIDLITKFFFWECVFLFWEVQAKLSVLIVCSFSVQSIILPHCKQKRRNKYFIEFVFVCVWENFLKKCFQYYLLVYFSAIVPAEPAINL